MEADTRCRVKPKPKPKSKNFRVERCDITQNSPSEDDVCDDLLNPSSATDEEFNRLIEPLQRRSSEYEERGFSSQRSATVTFVTEPQSSSGESCMTPLLKKSSLKEGTRKGYGVDEKMVTTATGGIISKGLRRAFSFQQDCRTNDVRNLNKRVSVTLLEKGEHVSRPIQRKPSKPEPVKAFVRFAEKITVPSTGFSLSPDTTRHNFFQQRASFQSDTGKLTQPLSGAANNDGSSLLKQDTGIICSNNDLRLILCDAKQQRRHSADVRREKMKTNRSLSFDSSIFRLRKNSSSETTILHSKRSAIASIASTTTNTACSTVMKNPLQLDASQSEANNQDNQQKPMIQILVTSDSPEEEHPQDPEASTSPTEDGKLSASRRSSNCSNAEVAAPSGGLLSPDANVLTVEEGFKVPWDESSVVDATILGNAIETYLTDTERRLSTESSLRSSLKSLFVK